MRYYAIGVFALTLSGFPAASQVSRIGPGYCAFESSNRAKIGFENSMKSIQEPVGSMAYEKKKKQLRDAWLDSPSSKARQGLIQCEKFIQRNPGQPWRG